MSVSIIANGPGFITRTANLNQTISSGYVTAQTLWAYLNKSGSGTDTIIYSNATNGALTADIIHFKPYVLVASTPQTIDLTSIVDLGLVTTQAAARIREFQLYNPDPVVGHDVTVYRGASNGVLWLPDSTHPLTAYSNGGGQQLFDPSSINASVGQYVDSTHKNIVLDPGSHNVTVYLFLLGNSVA